MIPAIFVSGFFFIVLIVAFFIMWSRMDALEAENRTLTEDNKMLTEANARHVAEKNTLRQELTLLKHPPIKRD